MSAREHDVFHSSCINCCYSKVFGKALRQISELLENFRCFHPDDADSFLTVS